MASSLTNPFECSICLDEFKNPKLVNCHHSFCYKCLANIAKTSSNNFFKCPVCRTEIEIPKGGVGEFCSNFYVNVFIKENTPQAVEIERKSDEKVKQNMCTVHPKKEVEFYCEDCETIVCSKCVFGPHKLHALLDLDADETRSRFTNELTDIKENITLIGENLRKLSTNVHRNFENQKLNGEFEISRIDKHLAEIFHFIKQNADDLKSQINSNILKSQENICAMDKNMALQQESLKDISDKLQSDLPVVDLIKTIREAKNLESFLALSQKEIPLLKYFDFKVSQPWLCFPEIGNISLVPYPVINKYPLSTVTFGKTVLINVINISHESNIEKMNHAYKLKLVFGTVLDEIFLQIDRSEDVDESEITIDNCGLYDNGSVDSNCGSNVEDDNMDGLNGSVIDDDDNAIKDANDPEYFDDDIIMMNHYGDDYSADDDDIDEGIVGSPVDCDSDNEDDFIDCLYDTDNYDTDNDTFDYSITLINWKYPNLSIIKSVHGRSEGKRFLDWESFIDPLHGFVDEYNCFGVKVTCYHPRRDI